jgi:hypothetical protein
MLEIVEGGNCLLEVVVMCCVLFCMLEAVKGRFCLPEVVEVPVVVVPVEEEVLVVSKV